MKRVINVAAVSAAVGLLLVGCSNPGASSGGSDSAVRADGSAKVMGKSLTVWTNSADPDSVKAVYTRFGEKYGVKMNLVEIPADGFETQVQTKWSSGDRPDILEYHAESGFWALNPKQNMYDLSEMPYVKKSGDIYDQVGSLDGKTYAAVTQSPGLLGVFYNKSVFEKNGLTPPKTFSDLASICTTLKKSDPSVSPLYESGGSSWPTQILMINYMSSAQKQSDWANQVIAKKATFSAPDSPFLEGLEQYQALKKNGCFNKDATTGTYEKSIKAVVDGTSAMVAQGSDLSIWNTQTGSAEKTDATIGFAPVSADGATAAWGANVAGTWFVPKTGDTKNESTALAFIQYATGEGYQQFIDESKTFPLIEGATDPSGVQKLQSEIAEDFRTDSALAFNTNLVGFSTAFPEYTTGILSGQESPQDAVKKAQTAFEQGAKAAHLPGW